MELPDSDLVKQLEARDGPLAARYRPHSDGGGCRFAALYGDLDRVCPWCEAERRRREGAAESSGDARQ